MPNPQTQRIILKDRVEMDADGRGSHLKIYAIGGETYRIPEKRNQLWDIFKNANKYEPILTTFESYKNNEYITDAELIKEKILNRAVKNLAYKIADAQTEERNRSQAIAYSKDLVCSGQLGIAKLYEYGNDIYMFIKKGLANE